MILLYRADMGTQPPLVPHTVFSMPEKVKRLFNFYTMIYIE